MLSTFVDCLQMTSIEKAIFVVGSASKLSRELGVTVQAVCFWRDGKRKTPADLCPDIERVTNGAVRCEDLRPDVNWALLRHSGRASV